MSESTTEKNREAGIMELIYNKINDMIGAGNQLFSMQFPAQPLNPNMYRYDVKDRTSVLTRPFIVAEQEFRLADQLFDVSPITAGSNGEKLSVVYNTLINNMIPKLAYLAPFLQERAGLGAWLLEASGKKNEQGESLSRIDLCKKLYSQYLEAKNQWNEDKNKKFEDLRNKIGGADEYAKWQSSYGMVRTEQLNNLYNDVVISGHLHEVLTILGYLNASSIAEELELSKQKMRNSARLSLDESLTVYPVQFSPNNWFQALSPNLNPEDLTMAKDSIQDIYLDKQKELLRLKGDLQKAELITATKEDVAAAQKLVDHAKSEFNSAELGVIKGYGEGIVGVAKIYFDTYGKSTINKAKAIMVGAPDPSPEDYIKGLQSLVNGISSTYKEQQALTTAMDNLSTTMAREKEIASKEWTLNKETMKQRINELSVDVEYYGKLLSGTIKLAAKQNRVELKQLNSNNQTVVYQLSVSDTITGGSFNIVLTPINVSTDEEKVIQTVAVTKSGDTVNFGALKETLQSKLNPTTPATITVEDDIHSPGYYTITMPAGKYSELTIDEQALLPMVIAKNPVLLPKQVSVADSEIEGMFSDIVLKINDSTDKTTDDSSANASNKKWGVSTWFASASGSSSESSASSALRSDFFNQEIEIGFRVAKVSFDRGGWFNPQIFKMSHAFWRLAELKIAPGLTVDQVKAAKNKQDLNELLLYKDGDTGEKYPYILPAFPIAMVIAKDVTIKVKKSKMTSMAAKSVVENSNTASGGFLCFTVSSSSSSKNSSEASMHGSHGEYYYIRIPGPQVIGYFLQMVAKDSTEKYEVVETPDGKHEVIDAFNLFNRAPDLLKK
jgi:hypothetical protein